MTACSSIQMTTLHNAALPGDPIVFSFHIIYKPILRKIKESIDRKFRHEASLSYCSHITLNSQSTKFVISGFPPNLPGICCLFNPFCLFELFCLFCFLSCECKPNRQHRPHNRCRDREVDINNCLCSIAEHRQNRRQNPGALFPFSAHSHAGAAQKRKIGCKRKRSHCNKVLEIFVVGALIENSIPIQRILPEIPSQNSICVWSKTNN